MAEAMQARLWRPGALLAWAVAVGVLTRRLWGPLLEVNVLLWIPDGRLVLPALVYAGVSAGLALVLWILTQYVEYELGYRGLDRPALIAVALLAVDVLANLSLLWSSNQGFAFYPIPLGVMIALSYPQFIHVALGTAL